VQPPASSIRTEWATRSSTKGGAPVWEIRYTETVPDRTAALKREYEIKKKKSRNYIEWLIQKGD